MQSGIVVRSTMAQMGVERSWSHHTGLTVKSDERIIEDMRVGNRDTERAQPRIQKQRELQGAVTFSLKLCNVTFKTTDNRTEIY